MPGPYQSYRDSNGVTWTVMEAANGWTMIGSVLDEADPRYDPPPPDVTASLPQPMDIGVVVRPTDEQTRVIFTQLRAKMEEAAAAHKGKAVLQVKASKGGGVLLLLLALALALADD
jgi:hypothetical protein